MMQVMFFTFLSFAKRNNNNKQISLQIVNLFDWLFYINFCVKNWLNVEHNEKSFRRSKYW